MFFYLRFKNKTLNSFFYYYSPFVLFFTKRQKCKFFAENRQKQLEIVKNSIQ